MARIPKMHDSDVSLRHLKVLGLLLEVQNLTLAAEILDTNQSAVSKILAKLRKHFGDPLFVRSGRSMHPTPRALEIAQPLKGLLESAELLRSSTSVFDPRASQREFRVIVADVGMIQLVPPLMRELERLGGTLRIKALPLDSHGVFARLEAGEADIALGSFPAAAGSMRRQRLFSDSYVSVARRGHPRLSRLSNPKMLLKEHHVIVSASSTGHAAHRLLEHVLVSQLDADRIQISVPSFVTCAFIASRTDAVGILPALLAEYLADDLRLAVFPTPLNLPLIEIGQFWHERVTRDAGHRWFRARLRELFGQRRAARPGGDGDPK
jgi:DNA-binding transcriptional LysR family regulator